MTTKLVEPKTMNLLLITALFKAVLMSICHNMSFQDYEKGATTFFENREDQRRWEVQCEIRKQVWTEMYDVFGWMYLNDSDYHEAITEEVDRRVALHLEKEKQILESMGEKIANRDVPQNVPDDSDLVHLVEVDVSSSPKEEEKEVDKDNKKDDIFEEEKRLWQEKLDADVKKWIQEVRNGEEYEW